MVTAKTKSTYDLDHFAGKWVAFIGERVVDSAATLPALMAKLRHKKFTSKPSVMLIPRKDEGPYILILL